MALSRPLEGKRVLVTRRGEQAAPLLALLAERGAICLELPLIEVVPPEDTGPLDRAMREIDSYQWIVFTSANAVGAVGERLRTFEGTADLPRGIRVATVGPATSEAVRSTFPARAVDVEPAENHSALGLLHALEAHALRGGRLLLPLSDRAKSHLAEGLRAQGAMVEVVVAYRTISPQDLRERLDAVIRAGVDVVTLASPSAVDHFVSALREVTDAPPVAVIGRVTEQAARSSGLAVVAVAASSTASGLVEAICQSLP